MAEDEQAQAETSALNMLTLVEITFPGEMAEWLKAHAWKAYRASLKHPLANSIAYTNFGYARNVSA